MFWLCGAAHQDDGSERCWWSKRGMEDEEIPYELEDEGGGLDRNPLTVPKNRGTT